MSVSCHFPEFSGALNPLNNVPAFSARPWLAKIWKGVSPQDQRVTCRWAAWCDGWGTSVQQLVEDHWNLWRTGWSSCGIWILQEEDAITEVERNYTAPPTHIFACERGADQNPLPSIDSRCYTMDDSQIRPNEAAGVSLLCRRKSAYDWRTTLRKSFSFAVSVVDHGGPHEDNKNSTCSRTSEQSWFELEAKASELHFLKYVVLSWSRPLWMGSRSPSLDSSKQFAQRGLSF